MDLVTFSCKETVKAHTNYCTRKGSYHGNKRLFIKNSTANFLVDFLKIILPLEYVNSINNVQDNRAKTKCQARSNFSQKQPT